MGVTWVVCGTRPPLFKEGPLSRSVEECVLFGTEDVVVNDFLKNACIPEGDGQVASGSVSLPDPVVLETEEQMLEREQDECDVLDELGEYKCDTGIFCGGCESDC